MKAFFDELRRRKVSRTAVVYAVVAWAVIESSSVIFPALHLPEWTVTFVVVIALIGFPVTLVFAWVFDLTREGVVRTPRRAEIPAEQAGSLGRGRVIDFVIIAVLLAVIGWLGWERAWDRPEPVQEAVIDSIAVLPFANLSGDPENEYFGDGLAEELLNALVRVEGLRVAARTSSFEYKGQHIDVRRIAEALGVASILEGSVRKAGDRVRITAQLVRAEDGFHLWSQTFDRRLEDIFAVQDEIALAIVDALRVTLGSRERERVVARPTTDVVAFEAYLRGRFEMHKRSPASLERAIEEFRTAIARDPEFAAAYSGLSDSWLLSAEYGGVASDEALRQAEPMAQRALRLDPELAEAHASWGLVQINKGDPAAAITPLERAIELNPSYSVAFHWLGLAYSMSGRLRESTEVIRQSLEIDPGYITGKRVLLSSLRSLGEHAEADELARDIERQHGNDALALHSLAADAMMHGDLVRAVQLAANAVRLDPAALHIRQLLANLLIIAGDIDRADEQMAVVIRRAPGSVAAGVWPARRALEQGDVEGALEAMRNHVQEAPRVPELDANACMVFGAAGAYEETRRYCLALLEQQGWSPGEPVPVAGVDAASILVAAAQRHGDEATFDKLLPAVEAQLRQLAATGFDPERVSELDAIMTMLRGDPEPFLQNVGKWAITRYYSLRSLETDAFFDLAREDPRFTAVLETARARQAEVRREIDGVPMPD